MKDLIKRCRDQMNITLKVRDSVKELIAKEGFDPKYGARPLKRYLQKYVETLAAKLILEGMSDPAIRSLSMKRTEN